MNRPGSPASPARLLQDSQHRPVARGQPVRRHPLHQAGPVRTARRHGERRPVQDRKLLRHPADDRHLVPVEVLPNARRVNAALDPPSFSRPRSPIPDSISNCGVLNVPPHRITSHRAWIVFGTPFSVFVFGVARVQPRAVQVLHACDPAGRQARRALPPAAGSPLSPGSPSRFEDSPGNRAATSRSRLGETLSPIADNPLRTPNLWVFDEKGMGKQLTIFTGGAVRWPAVATRSGDIAFEYGPDIYFLRHGEHEPRKLTLFAMADEKQTTRRREKLSSGAVEAEPLPDGKTFAFGLHGDIWTIPIDKPKGVAGRGGGGRDPPNRLGR